MNIFAKGVLPITVKEGKLSYHAGALMVRAAMPVYSFAYGDALDGIRKTYQYNPETKDFNLESLTRNQQIEFQVLLNDGNATHKLAVVMAASEGLEFATVLDWFFNEPDFFEKCYKEAIKLNPDLAPKEDLPAQADTKEEAEANF